MIRKRHNNWDGYNEQHHECPYEDWDGNDRRQPIIIEQPSQSVPQDSIVNRLLASPGISIVYGILLGIGSYVWNQHDQIKNMEFKIQQLSDKHVEHEKSDVEFKDQYKDISKKIDALKDQIQSVEQTVMSLYSSSKMTIKTK